VARSVFLKTDPSLKVKILIKDGSRVKPGDIIGTISGRVAGILKAERTALNFLQRLSGVATITAQYVAETRGYPTTIIETRKTTPGLRWLEKYAVRMGGGKNHRFNLGDMVLVKDNHIAALRARGMSLKDIVAKAKEGTPYGMKLEVEITAVDQAPEVVAGGADIIMLDNMSAAQMRQVVDSIPKHVKTEASGGITLENIRAVAGAGVDFISVGALTHSTKALNISVELELGPVKP
ncbi:MAG: carboxylating nicotinate-nucleotide diphosphorylase, partial [Chloroflexota bacterium]|nr:carboxylating nicotinate-nucleotide diphosphorylase [Chloroflexota bacterium]